MRPVLPHVSVRTKQLATMFMGHVLVLLDGTEPCVIHVRNSVNDASGLHTAKWLVIFFLRMLVIVIQHYLGHASASL